MRRARCRATGGGRAVWPAYTGGRLTSITDPLGHNTTFGYDSSSGDLVSVTNNGGAVTSFGYNTAHQVNKVTQVDAGGDAVTRLTYPSASRTLVAAPDSDQSQPVATAAHTSYTLDASDRVTSVLDPDGNTRSRSYTADFDAASSTIGTGTGASTSTATYGANGGESMTGASSPTGAGSTLAYGNSGAGKYSPSGGTDSQGNSSAFAYDTAGNVSSGGNPALAATAKVTYHPDGTVATATDPGNGSNHTSYTQDGDHQLIRITPVTGGSLGVRTFSYDNFARLKTATDGAGHTTTYTYDLDDRVTQVSYSDSTPTVSYSYDSTGRLKTRTDGSGTTSYGYDQLNRLTSRVNSNGGGTIRYGYDPAGHQSSLTDSRGTTRYSYTPGGQLHSMTTAPGTLVLFGYDDHARRTDTWDDTAAGHTSVGGAQPHRVRPFGPAGARHRR